jgi:hypothetical protein
MLKKIYVVSFLMINVICFSFAQDEVLNQVSSKFKEFQNDYLQEKLFLHTDKQIYFTGETIWFKTYLLDAKRHIPKTLSKIIYVELLNSNNQPITTQILKTYDGLQGSEIYLPDTLKSDYYKLRAYTKWMLNFDWNFIFEKEVLIIQNLKLPQSISVQNEIKSYIKDTSFTVLFEPSPLKGFDLKLINNTNKKNVNLFIISDGTIQYSKRIDYSSTLTNIEIPENMLLQGFLDIVVFDDSLNLLAESYHYHSNNTKDIFKLKTSQEVYKPRDKITIDIILLNEFGQPIEADLSLSVSSIDSIYDDDNNITNFLNIYSNLKDYQLSEQMINNNQRTQGNISNQSRFDWKRIANNDFPNLRFQPEKNIPISIVFPKDIGLNSFSKPSSDRHRESNLNALSFYIKSKKVSEIIYEEYEIYKNQDQQPTYEELPSDFNANLSNYVKFNTIKEVFREVITMIKIIGKGAKSEARILNSDDSRNKFFLKGNPLLIIDDIIVEHFNDILELLPNEVESIAVVWRNETLKKIQLGALSNYGIIIVKTKNSYLQNKKYNTKNNQIWQGFHKPKLFYSNSSKKENINENPDFRTQIYWNPKINTKNGKAKVSFNHSDDLGTFRIQIEGITNDGKPVSLIKKYQVDFSK